MQTPLTQPCFPLSVIMSLMIRWLSCKNGTMRVLALFSGEPKVTDVVDSGGCIAIDIFCDLPLPLSPFKAPPHYGCISWFGMYWGARQRVPLLLAFRFLVGNCYSWWNRDLSAEGKRGHSQRDVQWFGYSYLPPVPPHCYALVVRWLCGAS